MRAAATVRPEVEALRGTCEEMLGRTDLTAVTRWLLLDAKDDLAGLVPAAPAPEVAGLAAAMPDQAAVGEPRLEAALHDAKRLATVRRPEAFATRVEGVVAELHAAQPDAYRFEALGHRARRRLGQAGKHSRDVLLRRLQLTAAALGQELMPTLEQFVRDVILDIDYYERRIAEVRAELAARTRVALAFGFGAIGLLVVVGLVVTFAKGAIQQGGMITTQVGLIVGGILGALQILVARTDCKAQLGVFWKASADLKQVLYTFEDRWRGHACPNGALDPQFGVDLEAALEKGREIVEQERGAFFSSLRSPTDLLASVSGIIDTLRQRRQEAAASVVELARADAAAPGSAASRAQEIEQARKLLREAEAARAAKQGLVARLEGERLDAEAKSCRLELARAEAEVTRVDALLKSLLNSH